MLEPTPLEFSLCFFLFKTNMLEGGPYENSYIEHNFQVSFIFPDEMFHQT